MKWIVAAILLLLIGMALNLTLLVCGMYAIVAIVMISNWVTRDWTEFLSAERRCSTTISKIGEMATVSIKIAHAGTLPIAWLLVGGVLQQRALAFKPPALGVQGTRLIVRKLRSGKSKQLFYQLECNRRHLRTEASVAGICEKQVT